MSRSHHARCKNLPTSGFLEIAPQVPMVRDHVLLQQVRAHDRS